MILKKIFAGSFFRNYTYGFLLENYIYSIYIDFLYEIYMDFLYKIYMDFKIY